MNETFLRILKTLYALEHAMENAMILCQSWGFNGLKRKYRLYSTYLHYAIRQIECEMYDYHELAAPLNEEAYPAYHPSNIEDHLTKWAAMMRDVVSNLVMANKVLIPAIGKQNCYVEDVLKLCYKEKCKSIRMAKRFNEAGLHDLHMCDDILHKKMKQCEAEEVPKWI